MRFGTLVLLFCHLTLAFAQSPSQPAKTGKEISSGSSVTDQLVGAWRLVTIETFRANGETIYPFYGKHPEGLLLYDRTGWMSVQIVSDPKPTVPTVSTREGFLAASPAEKVTAIDGYYAYFGKWTVDASASTVTHHIVQSLYPGERGEDGVRQFLLEGDHLTLKAKAHEMGEDHQRKLVWERIHP